MNSIDYTLLYVHDVPASVAFYSSLLAAPPVEETPGFALFVLPTGLKLGVWKRAGVLPAPTVAAGGCEIAAAVEKAADVIALHEDWTARGIAIAQAPTKMDFGFTFTAQDPDGHRIRVFAPGDM